MHRGGRERAPEPPGFPPRREGEFAPRAVLSPLRLDLEVGVDGLVAAARAGRGLGGRLGARGAARRLLLGALLVEHLAELLGLGLELAQRRFERRAVLALRGLLERVARV